MIPQDVFEDRREEAYWSKSARERALDALVVADRAIKQQMARQTDAKKSATVKTKAIVDVDAY